MIRVSGRRKDISKTGITDAGYDLPVSSAFLASFTSLIFR